MKIYFKNKQLASAVFAFGTGRVLAHPNHGLSGGHWHATDVMGFVVAAMALAIAIWISRSGK